MSALPQAEKQRRMAAIVTALKDVYPAAVCALDYAGDPWRLLVMATLSAQCTDTRVNQASQVLFSHFPTPAALAAAPLPEIEEDIRSCGLFHSKARHIREASRLYAEEYGGVLPDRMEQLLRFPGVGRKVANLLLGDIYHAGGVVTDTHCIRICGRLGMYPETEKDPLRVEKILTPLISREEQSDFCHRIVQFGRDTCTARSPACATCPLAHLSLCHHATGTGLDASRKRQSRK